MQESFRVLICEPSEIVAVGIAHALQRCEQLELIATVSTLEQAIATIEVSHPDLVVLEPELPGTSGYEALQKILSADRKIKVLVLSSKSDEQSVFNAFVNGANGYCLKNVFSSYLVSAVYSVASGAAWLDQQIADLILPRADRPLPIRGGSVQHYKLSEREIEVLTLICEGLSNKQIAARLQLSQTTVKTYLRTLFRKLGVKDRVEAASHAAKQGLVGYGRQ